MTSPPARPLVSYLVPVPSRRPRRPHAVRITPAIDERLLVLGTTGSGKTTLAVHVLEAVLAAGRRALVMDTKGDDSLVLPAAVSVESFDALPAAWDGGAALVVYRPPAADARDWQLMDDVCQWAYEVSDLTLHINELANVASSNGRAGPGLLNCLTRGRSRSIGGQAHHVAMVMESQRPRGVPVEAYTEASTVVVMELSLRDDRKRVHGFTADGMDKPIRTRYAYRVYSRADRAVSDMPPVAAH